MELSAAERKHLLDADLVFVGEIQRLGDAPAVRTGRGVTARQAVVYKVESVLRGRWSQPEIAVHHIIVGGRTRHPDLERNELNPDVFRVGKKVIVAAKFIPAAKARLGEGIEKELRYVVVDDNEKIGPYDAEPERLEVVRRALEGQ